MRVNTTFEKKRAFYYCTSHAEPDPFEASLLEAKRDSVNNKAGSGGREDIGWGVGRSAARAIEV